MKSTGYFIKFSKIVLHFVSWGFFILLPFLLYSLSGGKRFFIPAYNSRNGWLLAYFLLSAFWIALLYFNSFFLIPKFSQSKNVRLYFALQLFFLIGVLFIIPLLFLSFSKDEGFNGINLQKTCAICIFPYLLILIASTAYQFIKASRHVIELGIANRGTLAGSGGLPPAFSSQLLHSVFNSITKMPDNDKNLSVSSLLKLSSLQHYYIYWPGQARITLKEDLQQVSNYVDLQQQVLKKNITVLVNPGIELHKYEIKPMQVIPFIESALNNSTTAADLLIEMSLNEKKNMLRIAVKDVQSQAQQSAGKGNFDVSLHNIKRRLVINCFSI